MGCILAVEGEDNFVEGSFDFSETIHCLYGADPDARGGDVVISHEPFTDKGD